MGKVDDLYYLYNTTPHYTLTTCSSKTSCILPIGLFGLFFISSKLSFNVANRVLNISSLSKNNCISLFASSQSSADSALFSSKAENLCCIPKTFSFKVSPVPSWELLMIVSASFMNSSGALLCSSIAELSVWGIRTKREWGIILYQGN